MPGIATANILIVERSKDTQRSITRDIYTDLSSHTCDSSPSTHISEGSNGPQPCKAEHKMLCSLHLPTGCMDVAAPAPGITLGSHRSLSPVMCPEHGPVLPERTAVWNFIRLKSLFPPARACRYQHQDLLFLPLAFCKSSITLLCHPALQICFQKAAFFLQRSFPVLSKISQSP